jgi:hypothetical protein
MTATARISATETAKEARAALKAAYPGVTFSVRASRSAGCNALSVSWQDGPTKAEVRPVVALFQGTEFDARDDSREVRGAYAVDSIHLHRD